MVKYKGYFFFSSLLIIIIGGLTSCSDNKKIEIKEYIREIATVNESEKNANDFTLDDGTKLWVAEPTNVSIKSTSKRALIDYSIISKSLDKNDYVVRLNGCYEIPTRDVVYINNDDTAKLDTIGNDPIKIISLWLGGGYLNVHFEFNTAGKIKHRINLIEIDINSRIGNNPIKLELRHDQMGDPENYPQKGYICFDLAPFENLEKEQIHFVIEWLDNHGRERSKSLIYKREQNNKEYIDTRYTE